MGTKAVVVPLGLGELYFKKYGAVDGNYRRVGTLRGDVEFTYSMETVEGKAGDMLGPIRRDKVDEHATLKATICDFRLKQLIPLFGMSTSTTGTGLTKTQSIRYAQEVLLPTASGTATLSHTMNSTTSARVLSFDGNVEYTKGTDYSILTGTHRYIRGITGTTTMSNKPIMVHYTFNKNTTATRVDIGDKTLLQEVSVLFVHKMSDNKRIQIEIPKATVMGDVSIPFHEKDYTAYDIAFGAVVDTTRNAGERLFKIIKET